MSTAAGMKSLSARQMRWDAEQKRFEASGLTAREFCSKEGLCGSTFYKRRVRIRELGALGATAEPSLLSVPVSSRGQSQSGGFIDAGPVSPFAAKRARSEVESTVVSPVAGVEVRIDLGAGVVLTITRR